MPQGEQVHLRLLSDPGLLEFCLCAYLTIQRLEGLKAVSIDKADGKMHSWIDVPIESIFHAFQLPGFTLSHLPITYPRPLRPTNDDSMK